MLASHCHSPPLCKVVSCGPVKNPNLPKKVLNKIFGPTQRAECSVTQYRLLAVLNSIVLWETIVDTGHTAGSFAYVRWPRHTKRAAAAIWKGFHLHNPPAA